MKNTDLELRRDAGARDRSESDWMIVGSKSNEIRSPREEKKGDEFPK